MASINDIKRRRNSISSTEQITKAMKLVSTVKLQKAKILAEQIHAYFNDIYATINSLLSKTAYIKSPFLQSSNEGAVALIVLSSNRGLAGGYNSNIAKLIIDNNLDKENVIVYALGHKTSDYLALNGFKVDWRFNSYIDEPDINKAKEICDYLIQEYKSNNINRIMLAYTEFKNTVTHIPHLLNLLPFDKEMSLTEDDIKTRNENTNETLINYELDEEEALDILIPNYLNAVVYGALIEAVASENGARMQAMDSATSNAKDLIDKLTLEYNRVRQSAITQEITEIIAGSDAI